MVLKHSVSFFLEKRKKDGMTVTGNVPIRMCVKFEGNRIEFTTGYRIDSDKWDATKQRVKSRCSNKLKQTALANDRRRIFVITVKYLPERANQSGYCGYD